MATKTKITVVGSGYVGMSLSVILAQHNDVTVLDIDAARVDKINSKQSTVADTGIELFSKDRFQPSGWLVIDAIDFVVHRFSQEQRENYAIEQLWKDAEQVSVEDLV